MTAKASSPKQTLRRIYAFTHAQPIWRECASVLAEGSGARVFLLKCLFWLGLVFALLPWPQGDGRGAAGRRNGAESKAIAKPKHPAAPAPGDALAAVTQAATDRLAAAAKEQCLAHPGDCLAILGAAASRKEPPAAR